MHVSSGPVARRTFAWPALAALALVSACTGEIAPGRADSEGGAGANRGSSDGKAPTVPGSKQGEIVAKSGIRRLSRAEIDGSLRDLLGDGSRPATRRLSEENIAVRYAFDNDSLANRDPSESYVEAVEGMVRESVRAALANPTQRAALVRCTPSGALDAECMRSTVEAFGRRALRRPLSADELRTYTAFSEFAAQASDFYRGVEGALMAMLTSPEFVYRIELGDEVEGRSDVRKLTSWEIASRLSFTLLGTTPDETLLAAAEGRELDSAAGIRAAAERLIDDPRARERVHQFHSYWLGYEKTLPPDMAPLLREETQALIDDVVFESRRDYYDLFLSDRTYIGDALRQHYTDIAAPLTGSAGWVPYGNSQRRGILSHASTLSGFKTGDDTSPTKRGLFVRLRLLCDDIHEPPPDVSIDLAAAATECKTGPQGFYAKSHAAEACNGCHRQMDPIGFGLEQFDARGRFRTHDDGKPNCGIDGQGFVETTVAGAPAELTFNGPGELGRVVVESGKLERCVVQHMYRFAAGRAETREDGPTIDALQTRFRELGRDYLGLLVELVSQPSFSYIRTPE